MADFSDLQGARFQEDLRRAAGYKPIIREDLDKAYKRYESVGVKFGRVGNKTDKQLYQMATNDVINWYKKNKKPANKAPAGPSNAVPTTLSRAQAAQITRQMGLDPAEVFGWGGMAQTGKRLESYWANTQAAQYIWRSPQSFAAWLQRTYGGK